MPELQRYPWEIVCLPNKLGLSTPLEEARASTGNLAVKRGKRMLKAHPGSKVLIIKDNRVFSCLK